MAASDERCGVFCTKLRVRGAFQCAKLCRGVQGVQVRCGASGSVARCNGDAVACNKVGCVEELRHTVFVDLSEICLK